MRFFENDENPRMTTIFVAEIDILCCKVSLCYHSMFRLSNITIAGIFCKKFHALKLRFLGRGGSFLKMKIHDFRSGDFPGVRIMSRWPIPSIDGRVFFLFHNLQLCNLFHNLQRFHGEIRI